MAHKRLTINQRELAKYLRSRCLPWLNGEWMPASNDMILRRSGIIVQGLYFDRSSYGKRFVPNYFIQVLSIARDHYIMQIGDRLRDKRKAELWLDWDPESDSQFELIVDVYSKQAKPALSDPLTLEVAIEYIETYHAKSKHFFNMWSLGILYGFQGDLSLAKDALVLAIEDIKNKQKDWISKGKMPPSWMEASFDALQIFIDNLQNHKDFSDFCIDEAKKTMKELKLT